MKTWFPLTILTFLLTEGLCLQEKEITSPRGECGHVGAAFMNHTPELARIGIPYTP